MGQQVRVYRMLDLSPAALIPFTSRLYPVMRLGDRTKAVNVKMATDVGAQHLDPVQFNINVIGANPSDTSTINTIYQKITHDTMPMAALRLKCADWNVVVGKNVLDAYVYQGEIKFTAGVIVGGEACVMGLVLDAGTSAITGGVRGLKISMGGSGLPASTSAGLSIDAATAAVLGQAIFIETQSGTIITTGLYMGNAGTFTNAIFVSGTIENFLNLALAGNSGFVTSGDKGVGISYTLKIITPDGADGYIKVYAVAP